MRLRGTSNSIRNIIEREQQCLSMERRRENQRRSRTGKGKARHCAHQLAFVSCTLSQSPLASAIDPLPSRFIFPFSLSPAIHTSSSHRTRTLNERRDMSSHLSASLAPWLLLRLDKGTAAAAQHLSWTHDRISLPVSLNILGNRAAMSLPRLRLSMKLSPKLRYDQRTERERETFRS